MTDEEALKRSKMAAECGSEYAKFRLGCAYEFGELDVAIDLEAARTCYQKAAGGGGGHAQRRLGTAYEKGELDLAIDLEAALMWLQKAQFRETIFFACSGSVRAAFLLCSKRILKKYLVGPPSSLVVFNKLSAI